MPDGISNVNPQILKLAEQYQACNVRSRALNEERKQIRENVDKLGITPNAFTVALAMTRDMTAGERADYTASLTSVLGALDGKENDLFGAEEMRKRDERKKKAEERANKAAGGGTTSGDDNPKSDPKKGGAGGANGRGKAKDGSGKQQARGRGRGTTGGDNVVPLNAGGQQAPSGEPPAPTQPPVGDPPAGEPPAGEEDEGGPREGESTDDYIKRHAAELNAKREQREGAQVLGRVNNGENGTPKSQSQLSAEALERAKLN